MGKKYKSKAVIILKETGKDITITTKFFPPLEDGVNNNAVGVALKMLKAVTPKKK